MARHSHWAQIKLKKGALDKKRGKVFTKHSRLIEVAARTSGGDPDTNPSLRFAIDNARADNLPKENIERAIRKGTGELKEGNEMQAVTYEAFGPGGAAILIDVLTDNKNRANQMVRGIVEKYGGKLGVMGSVNFLFENKGVLHVAKKGERDADELEIIDAGAEEIEEEGTGDITCQQAGGQQGIGAAGFLVYTFASGLGAVKKKLEEKGFKVLSAELAKIPKSFVEISDQEATKEIRELLEALEEEEDILNIYINTTV